MGITILLVLERLVKI